MDLPPVRFTYQTHDLGFEGNPISWRNPSVWGATKGNLVQNWGLGGGGTYTDVVDMDGDGRVDRVVYDYNYNYSGNNFQPAMWRVYFNTGSGFEQTPVLWPNPSPWGNANGNNIRDTGIYGIQTDVVDVNGDGLPDRVVKDLTSPYDTWEVYFNYGAGFGPPVVQQGQPRPGGWAWSKPYPEGWGGQHDGNLISEHYTTMGCMFMGRRRPCSTSTGMGFRIGFITRRIAVRIASGRFTATRGR